MMKVRFTKQHGSMRPGDIGECGDTDGAELIARGIAIAPTAPWPPEEATPVKDAAIILPETLDAEPED